MKRRYIAIVLAFGGFTTWTHAQAMPQERIIELDDLAGLNALAHQLPEMRGGRRFGGGRRRRFLWLLHAGFGQPHLQRHIHPENAATAQF